MKEFIALIIGNQSIAVFCALYFFALIGVTINLLIHSTTRDQNSIETPYEFSFKFLLWDNWKRILLNVLLIYASIRFASLIFTIKTENQEFYLFSSLFIGFIYDKLLEIWKTKANFLKVRKG
jgi:hypothetical protein